MYFKRKAYDKLLEWKKLYSEKYAVLLEGARRVGKSTIAETFAKNEYRSYILIDFSKTTSNILECFDDIGNLNIFFLRLQAETGITLYEHESLIIFDEVQLFPKARQAIKHLVHDGRYSYLETGSLISIKKNVKDILIPSEEMKLEVYPMDYEEFCDATGNNYGLLQQIYDSGAAIGQATNRKLMRDLRIYMAVGGMPQAVEAYVNGKNFLEIDMVKRQIISLYEEDFEKIDASGRISALYHAIPAHLAKDARICYVGNGGLSLRNIPKTIELLNRYEKYRKCWNTGEDCFFAYYGQENDIGFRVAPLEAAETFALESNARELITAGKIPWGVHAWEKYYPEIIE